MKITRAAMDIIAHSVSELPPETGGILGSHDDDLVDEIVMDLPATTDTRRCRYSPNVEFLNASIRAWQEKGVSFMGIFHTHFVGVRTLSSGDRKYITAIMNAMPQQIDALYFPVYVLPDREMVCYKAIRLNGIVDIQAENVIVV